MLRRFLAVAIVATGLALTAGPTSAAEPARKQAVKPISFSGTSTIGDWYRSRPFKLPAGRYRITATVTADSRSDTEGYVYMCTYLFDRINVKNGFWNRYFEIHDNTKPRWQTTDFVTSLDVYEGASFYLRVLADRGTNPAANAAFPCDWKLTIQRIK